MKEGWDYKKLGDICEYAQTRIDSKEISVNNYVGVDNLLQDCKGKKSALKVPEGLKLTKYIEGDVLIGNIRPYLKKIWLADAIGGCNGDVLTIRRKPQYTNCIDALYIFKCLSSNTFFDYAMQFAKGEKMPRGDKKEIMKYPVPIPPLSMQQQIVEELDVLSSIIEKKKAQLKEYDQLAQSFFYDMFGDPVTNDKGWEVKKLEEIASSKIGLTYKPADVAEEGTIVLRSSNIQDSAIDLKDIVRVSCKINEAKFVREGDILMCSRNGSFKLVGKVARIKILPEKMSYGAFMTIIRSSYNDYLFQFFKSPAFRIQLGTAKTATINQITVKMLDSIKVGVPPLDLQHQFASKIEAIEKQKELIKQSIKEVETLFNSRMDYYFN